MRLDTFAKNNLIMFLASSAGSFFNLLYQLMMLRLVSGSAFAALNSLLSLLVIISVPASAFTTMVTKHISASNACSEFEKLKTVWRVLAGHALIFSLIAFTTIVLFSRNISIFLRIDSVNSVVILGGMIFLSCLSPVVEGGLQGLEKFFWLAAAGVAAGFLKLVLSFGLIKMMPQLEGALLGFLLSSLAGILISFFAVSFLLKGKGKNIVDIKKLYIYILPISAVSLCLALLTNIDMLLVKHFFLQDSQGYAIAQMIGKIILFIPGAVYIIMFSRVSGLHASKRDSKDILKRSIFYTFVLSFIAVMLYNLFPGPVMKLLSAPCNPEVIALARILSWAMLFYALSNVLFFYQLSIEDYGFIKYLFMMTILQALNMSLFHKTTLSIAIINLLAAIAVFGLNFYSVFKKPAHGL